MITDQSQWKEPLVARDGKRTVGVEAVKGPNDKGNYLVSFAEKLTDKINNRPSWSWFKPDGTALYLWNRNITISPAAEGAGDICQLMPDGGGDASDETTASARNEMERAFAKAEREVAELQRNLDISNADHVALWLEAHLGDEIEHLGWLACRIVEAHERAIAQQETNNGE